ncbi:TIGR03936 family radical SAM-associated protein [Thermophilibacter sp.]
MSARPQPTAARPQDLPTKAELARLRVTFAKDERLAYLGHLDLISTIERCVRRSRLPFSVGNGFARRMRIQFTQALPVGASSACECYDVRLNERVDAAEALARLRAATPAPLAPTGAAYVDGRLPALEAWLDRSAWEVDVLGTDVGPEALSAALAELADAGTLAYRRGEKLKRVDLAQTLVSARVTGGRGALGMRLETRAGATGSLRPRVLLDAALERLGAAAPEAVRVRRSGQWHEAEDGRLVEPLGTARATGRAPLS